MWRMADATDDDAIASMCLTLNAEDPGQRPVTREQVLRTLSTLRNEPGRGRAVVLELSSEVVGYALLISFWSNELGGEVCTIDELFIQHHARARGHGRRLFELLLEPSPLWPATAVALALEVAPDNTRARALY